MAIVCGSALLSASALAQGNKSSDVSPGAQIQRLQQQQLEATQESNPRPTVLSPTGENRGTINLASLGADTPCFTIDRLILDDSTFGWLARSLQPVVGQCIGKIAEI